MCYRISAVKVSFERQSFTDGCPKDFAKGLRGLAVMCYRISATDSFERESYSDECPKDFAKGQYGLAVMCFRISAYNSFERQSFTDECPDGYVKAESGLSPTCLRLSSNDQPNGVAENLLMHASYMNSVEGAKLQKASSHSNAGLPVFQERSAASDGLCI